MFHVHHGGCIKVFPDEHSKEECWGTAADQRRWWPCRAGRRMRHWRAPRCCWCANGAASLAGCRLCRPCCPAASGGLALPGHLHASATIAQYWCQSTPYHGLTSDGTSTMCCVCHAALPRVAVGRNRGTCMHSLLCLLLRYSVSQSHLFPATQG